MWLGKGKEPPLAKIKDERVWNKFSALDLKIGIETY